MLLMMAASALITL